MLTLPKALTRVLPQFVKPLAKIPFARTSISWLVINQMANATTPRPRALSLASDYTSWKSLTDRTFSGRHLPPATDQMVAELPGEAEVNDLYRRDGQMLPSTDTSVMFMFFAQWFTDSFLRTSHTDFRRNTSNHEIDLCQIYGLSEDKTRMLRALTGGRLKSQNLDGEEYPEFLFLPRKPGARPTIKPEFTGLHDEVWLIDTILAGASEAHKDTVFAVGLEHGNSTIGTTTLNVVFLREHNRIANLLAQEHRHDPDWDDDRLFETTRNIMIVLLLDLIVEEYITHIGPFDFPVENVRFIADGARWNRSNWCTIEFDLLYRWHSLVPDQIGTGPDALQPRDFRDNNPGVIARGIESLIAQCSRERSGRIGLHNTPAFLVDRAGANPSVEERTIALMRNARLASYNDYREHFGLARLTSFEDLTADEHLRKQLDSLYGDIDRLEWYVGIFAEDYPDYLMTGELMSTMVAYDAFTQALTNPLLARNVFNQATFSATGMQIIESTKSLEQIVARNSKQPDHVYASFSITG
jgi:prostaglandin-endoperoxide synthase 2